MMMTRDDLGDLYAKGMEHFGCGTALFQPVAAGDMPPPCIGYIDGNGKWNLVASIDWTRDDERSYKNDVSPIEVAKRCVFKSLEREPRKMEELGIEWRVRTSIGVRQWNVDASGHTP